MVIQDAFHDRRKNGGQQRAGHCRRHIDLSIPFVALRAEPRWAGPGTNDFGDDRLDDLKQCAEREHHCEWHPVSRRPAQTCEPSENLAHRKDEQESKGEVADSVERIARELKRSAKPLARRRFFVAVVGANGVKGEIDCDAQVRQIGKGEPVTSEDKQCDNWDDEEVFQKPCRAVGGRNRQADPKKCVNDEERARETRRCRFHEVRGHRSEVRSRCCSGGL